jgi:hypothetical protein
LAGKVKRKEHENLSDANIEKVMAGLNGTPPITKKDACAILNISYNTTRLQKIIDEYLHKKELDKKLRAANRGKPAQAHEIKFVIEQYLDGIPIGDIANDLYRNNSFVKDIITMVGVPTRGVGEDYTNYSPLPDRCVSSSFENGETAWSSKYMAPCIIIKEVSMSVDGEAKVYRIYVREPDIEPEVKYFSNVGKAGFYAHQPAYELGKLEHLKQYGVDMSRKV